MRRNFLDKLMNVVYPAKCGFCGDFTLSDSFICTNCKDSINHEYINRCRYCGKVTMYSEACIECQSKRIFYDRLLFCSDYTDIMKEKIHLYKFCGKKFYYNFFTELIYDKLFGINADIIVPVPISRERFRERGYNQSAIIAKKLSRVLNISYCGDALIKVKNSERQSIQNFRLRQESVKNVFKIADTLKVSGKDILLIDDVFATGATVNECSKQLVMAGAKSVVVVVISVSHMLK